MPFSPDSTGMVSGDKVLQLTEQLRDITVRFAAIDDVDSLVALVDELIRSTVNVPYYGLYLIDHRTGEFRLPVTHGFTAEEKAEAERTAMDRHPGWVLRNHKTLHVPDVEADQQRRTRSSRRGFTVRSRLWIPVMARNECVGAFGMAHHEAHAFSDLHISVLTFVSNLAGVVYRNLTSTEALRAALERAKAADRSKTAFLANMSHELRTPMNGVLGAASLLATTRLDREQRELLATVQSSSRSMVSLVDDLLESSKIAAGQLDISPEDTPLAPWLDSAIEIILPSLIESRLQLSLRIAPDAPHGLFVDALRARQVLLNLLSNAIKFTEYGGLIIHVERRDGDMVVIAVEDSGIGIPEDKAHLLFGRFSQVDDSINRRFGGTGLGLVISRQLAESMGGTLDLKWSVSGQGSCFELVLPSCVVSDRPDVDDLNVMTALSDPQLERDIRHACAWWGFHVPVVAPIDAPCRWITDRPDPHRPDAIIVGHGPDVDLRPPLRLGRLLEALIAQAPEPVSHTEQEPIERRQHVLVVDDNPVNRKVALRILANAGFRVSEAPSAKRAMDAIGAGDIDLCLLDVHMPDEDGITLTCRLRRGDAGSAGRVLPIVAFTADLLPQTQRLCLEAGMSGVLHKPIKPDDVVRSLEQLSEEGQRVLIVDDAATNRMVLRRMLKRRGVAVDEASSGAEAIECLAHTSYRYLILDENLGDMMGRDVVAALRAMNVPWRHMPVISSTASSVLDAPKTAYDDLLPKPIEVDALERVLHRWGPRVEEPSHG
ncbi:MAG: response regulator [Myxococcota bacterium]